MMNEIFKTILDMSLAGGVVILVVLLLRPVMARLPKKVTVFLWLPVLLQLILPLSIQSPVSLFNLLPRPAAMSTEISVPIDTGFVVNTGAAVPAQPETILPSVSTQISETALVSLWPAAGTVLWLTGMAVMVVWAAYRYGRLAQQMETAVKREGERNVYQSEYAASPFLLGIFRPKIYIPYDLPEAEAWHVLLHERTHLRCGDPILKLLAYGVLTLHWFNPLCWIAFVLFGRDLEMRCDEAVLAGSDAKEYSTALVKLAAGKRYSTTGPLAFGETSVRERVKHILSWKKPALWITIAAGVLCTVVGILCATDAVESPYIWLSVITAEDLDSRNVTLHGSGMYEAELTDAQLEKLAECLRNVPESAMQLSWRTKRSFKKLINYTIEGDSDLAAALLWDGERVFLSSVQRVGPQRTKSSVWYLKDPVLEAFFAELETAILEEQGTLVEESVPVSVYISGTDKIIAPKWYPEGTWDHDYEKLPVLIMPESGHLCIHVYWQPETLYVYEEYYNSLSAGTTRILRTTYTAAGPHTDGGYTIEVTRQNMNLPEQAVYYITNGEETYIFKVAFPATDAKGNKVVDLNPAWPPVSMEEAQWADTLGEYAPMAVEGAPKILKSYMKSLRDRDGLYFREARITGMDMERINTGTASDLAMFRMDFALMSEEVLVIPDGCTVEDGWITGEIWWNSPNLVRNAVEG